MFHNDPVGLPGLAALALGFFGFFVALFVARQRARKGRRSATLKRSTASIVWIVVQAVGIAFTAIGPVAVERDPLSPASLIEGAIVLLLMGSGVALFNASSRAMGKNWALVARTRMDHTLVQDGPFAVVRNPIYVALFLFLLAIAVAYGHEANLIVAIPVFALATWMRVHAEEHLLLAMFADEYRGYARRVKRFVPGVL